MSTDSAVSIGWDVLKCLVAPLKRGFSYVMSSKSYANNLQKEVGNLEYEAERIRHAAEGAGNNLQSIHGWVPEFLASAEKALIEAIDLLGEFEKATKTCCHGTLPDPSCRYQFSRKANHKTDDIKKLILENSNREISFSGPAPGKVAALIPAGREGKDVVPPTTTAASASSVDFESRALMIQNIMGALVDDRYSVVGVHGMGGIGKSTLLTSKGFKREIAHGLGLDFKNEEFVSVRAKRLCERLEAEGKINKNKVLIILDNLWEKLDLESVGIPCVHDNKVVRCKLLLTSRDHRVLRREMHCDNAFLLGGLKNEEAKRLFETTVGGKVQVELEPLVEEALSICAGLPFLILAIAKLFIDTSYSECKDALKQIWNEETGEVINKTLRVSYDRLKCEEAKSLLRLCVACGVSKPSLEYLVRYGMGLRLFREASNMEEARDRLGSLIHTLKASSLLLDDEDENGFKIHDLVRGFVTSVASRDQPLLVLKDQDKLITELPEEKLKSCGSICFPYTDMKKLPQELDCPELQIFLLFTNDESLDIPDSYFNSMRKLMVLNLTGICLTCSPSPFQFLKNLHTLCLDKCSLDNVAILGELKRLQILSFVDSKIQRLPKEIGQLVELRLLDLNYCSKLQIIEPGVLGNLIKLEELYMKNSFDQWNVMEQTPPTNANMIELNDMKYLKTLHISIPNPSVLPRDLKVEKLTKYEIRMGHGFWWNVEGSRILFLKWDPISEMLQKGCIQSILGKTDNLILDGLNGIEQSIYALYQKGFPELKHLQVMNIPSIHYILQSPSHMDFKTLESLFLKNLINLEKICTNNISSKSFSALKVVRVECCHKMEVLFPLSSMRELPQLEKIKIVDCMVMRGILEANESGKFELHNLHALKLHYLPEIKNFFITRLAPSSSTSDDQVATQIAFFNGRQVHKKVEVKIASITSTSLFNHEVAFPNLENLYIKGMDNIEMIWHDQIPADSFSKLKLLSVKECKKLVNVVPSFILGQLLSLETLMAKACDSLEVVFKLQPLNHLDRNSVATNLVELIELKKD
ncbi:probable disease resistance protein At4g27220 [Eucalyptus grandis]|uniref:probable disease resistance protein At4g27220 n=1 Tax=Eucalyptus grandis TaxID=71139 RepID=UPI00192ED4A1|nr:probable disease resistance protein At4g27220 [Eucalyptus grandis]